jgi:hypothetical protein
MAIILECEGTVLQIFWRAWSFLISREFSTLWPCELVHKRTRPNKLQVICQKADVFSMIVIIIGQIFEPHKACFCFAPATKANIGSGANIANTENSFNPVDSPQTSNCNYHITNYPSWRGCSVYDFWNTSYYQIQISNGVPAWGRITTSTRRRLEYHIYLKSDSREAWCFEIFRNVPSQRKYLEECRRESTPLKFCRQILPMWLSEPVSAGN